MKGEEVLLGSTAVVTTVTSHDTHEPLIFLYPEALCRTTWEYLKSTHYSETYHALNIMFIYRIHMVLL